MLDTGNLKLNEFLEILEPSIYLLYGGPGTGKTTFALQTALTMAKKGKVLFVDTESSFAVDRIKQMDTNYEKLLENIMVIKVKNFEDQENKFKFVEELVTGKFNCLIIDSLTNHYRYDIRNNDYRETNLKLIGMLRRIKHVSEKVPVVLTSQVYANMENKGSSSLGGNMLKNFCKTIIEMEKEPKRNMKMLKPKEKNSLFVIRDEGLVLS